MSPHCDALDGPVVRAARHALEVGDVTPALAYVPASAEEEVRATFASVVPVRALGHGARLVAERLFLETVVRLHREAEGAPFTGLKPAELDVGPVVPLAEEAVETGSVEDLTTFLGAVLTDELHRRLAVVNELGGARNGSVERERAWVQAVLGFQDYSQSLFETLESPGPAPGTHRKEATDEATDEATEAPGREHDPVP
ncbi:DUF6448 family protein [Terrabacter sp. NPDC080008]|uniref:DUF6448 family protein n=1 Tax=Terrabacter sp. NPDC080008 TaxID=3155176 RepID=UPI00344F9ED5